jgi:fucose permease
VALILGSLAVTTGGFMSFWLFRSPPAAVAGLAVTGLGIANLFPLALSLTVANANGATDTATARAQLLAGVAALIGPFALGVAADLVGVRTALSAEFFLIALATGLLVLARTRRKPIPA